MAPACSQNVLTEADASAWLADYEAAWENRDADAAAALFADDVRARMQCTVLREWWHAR